MADYNILFQDCPVSGRALAKINSAVSGAEADMTSVKCVWKDHLGVTISDQTRTTVDISTTGIHGEAITITDETGTGKYQATLVIDSATYSAVGLPKNFTLTVTITDSNGSHTETFTFRVVSSVLDINLESTSVVTAVRRKTGMLKDIAYLAEGTESTKQSNFISLGAEIIYGIDAAYKNGGAFAAGATGDTYAWVTYRPNVKLNTSPASNDHFLFTIKTTMSEAAVEEYILSARRRVLAALRPHYDDDALDTYPTVLGLIEDICVGEIRQLMSAGAALESAHYRSGRDLKFEALGRIKRIQNGSDGIEDWDGVSVTRKAGALIGGFRHADGAIDERGDWWDRLREYQSTIFLPAGQAST